MEKEKHVANFNSPMRMQGTDIDTVHCRDCVYRLRQPFELNGKIFDSGATKVRCDIYPADNKPLDILLKNARCKHYKKDNNFGK